MPTKQIEHRPGKGPVISYDDHTKRMALVDVARMGIEKTARATGINRSTLQNWRAENELTGVVDVAPVLQLVQPSRSAPRVPVGAAVAGEPVRVSLTFADYQEMRGAELIRGGFSDDEVGAILRLSLAEVVAIRHKIKTIPRVPRSTGIRRQPTSIGNIATYGRTGVPAGGDG